MRLARSTRRNCNWLDRHSTRVPVAAQTESTPTDADWLSGGRSVELACGSVKLSMQIGYAGGFAQAVEQVAALEKVGLDIAYVAEAYGYDAPTLMEIPRGQDGSDRLGHPAALHAYASH